MALSASTVFCVFVFVSVVRLGGGRPWCRPCQCDNERLGGVRLLCAGKGLTTFPRLSPAVAERVTLLALQRNRVRQLDGSALEKLYSKLKRLDIGEQEAPCVLISPPFTADIKVEGMFYYFYIFIISAEFSAAHVMTICNSV